MMETNDAERNEGRALLPTGEGQGRVEGESRKNLPSIHGVVVEDRQKAKEQKERTSIGKSRAEIDGILPVALRKALVQANGHVSIAAQTLHTNVETIDRIVRKSKDVQTYFKELKRTRFTSEWEKGLVEELERDMAHRAVIYKSQALDAIHEIANMPLDPNNSMQNQVKLVAATKLYNDSGGSMMGGEIEQTLRALNVRYHETAPRIKSIRERTIEFTQDEANEAINVSAQRLTED